MKNWATNLTADPVLCMGLAIIMLTLILAMAYFFAYWCKERAEKRKGGIVQRYNNAHTQLKVSTENFREAVNKFGITAEQMSKLITEQPNKECN